MAALTAGAQQPAAARARAVPRTIADAIAHRGEDDEVLVTGRATVASGKLQSTAFDVAIQDSTGGLRVFSRTPQAPVREGDSLEASGAIKVYRGNLELVVTALRVLGAPQRQVAPRDLATDTAAVRSHGGELVRVHGRVAGTGRSEGGQWVRLRDAQRPGAGTLTVWVPANHGGGIDLSKLTSGDSLVVTGIVTSYQDISDEPVVWQVIPRDRSDVEVGEHARSLPPWALWIAALLLVALSGWLVFARVAARRELHALQETETRYRQLLALLPDAVIVHADGQILFTNPAAAQLLGHGSYKDLVGHRLAEFVHPESLAAFVDAPAGDAAGAPERAPRVRGRMVSASGNDVDVEAASSPCVFHDRPAMFLLARDITAQLRYERDLHALALVDELTGLANRRAFTLFADQELARARRHGRTPVLVFADLDGLKQINDQHGHAAGDAAIRLVAHALRSIFRETDIVARWSGDEFVALMVDGSTEAAREIDARLDTAIRQLAPDDLPYEVTASVGANQLDPALPLRDAMERADAELYEQKKRGRRSKIRPTPLGMPAIDVDGRGQSR